MKLYRGDADHVEAFTLDKCSDWFALFGLGLYLTSDWEVASDYTLKDGTNVEFRAEDLDARSERDLLIKYLRHVLEYEMGWREHASSVTAHYREKLWTRPDEGMALDEWQAAVEAELQEALRKDLQKWLKKAKAIIRDRMPSLEIVKLTTAEHVLVRKGPHGFVSEFDVPPDYIDRTLHGDRPLPDDVLWHIGNLLKSMVTGFMDFRDLNNEFRAYQAGSSGTTYGLQTKQEHVM